VQLRRSNCIRCVWNAPVPAPIILRGQASRERLDEDVILEFKQTMLGFFNTS
jgi:hypothetical protein